MEVVSSKHNRSSFMAEVRATRAGECRQLGQRGRRRHEAHGARPGRRAGSGRPCRGGSAGDSGRCTSSARCRGHCPRNTHCSSIRVPRWSCSDNTCSNIIHNISQITYLMISIPSRYLKYYLEQSNKVVLP